MRTFLALIPDAEAALRIDDWRARHWAVSGREVPVQNLHVTLCFLGDVDGRRLEKVALALDERVVEPLALDVVFDDPVWRGDAGLAWLGASAPPAPLLALVKRLRSIAGHASIRVGKRAFLPHVTLARRVGLPPPPPLSRPALECRFERVELMESLLAPDGVRYRPLDAWPR